MEYLYTANTKIINEREFYFIKRFMIFPELEDACQILDGYGMHDDFHKACKIAGITEQAIKENLWFQVEPQAREARIIHLNIPSREPKIRRLHFNELMWKGLEWGRLKFKF